MLTDAVVAYKAALQDLTRERHPRAWAMIQNNLGAAFQTLGERGYPEALRRGLRGGTQGAHPRAGPTRLGGD